jgi:hypothetical protein
VKSLFGIGLLSLAVVVSSQACGSSDEKTQRPGNHRPEGGAAGASLDAAGAPDGASMAGTAGALGEGGAPGAGTAGTTGTGGAGAGTTGGSGGEGGTEPPGSGNAGEGAEGGFGGVSGEGGAAGAGEEVTCEVAASCSQDLSAVGTGDFSIAFTITTVATVSSGIVSQRSICMHSKFWDIRLRSNGTGLSVELDDQANYTSFVAPMVVNDGVPHEVRVCRKSGRVYAFADGKLSAQAVSATNLATLPAFATSTSKCGAEDGTVTLVGTLTNVCVGAL